MGPEIEGIETGTVVESGRDLAHSLRAWLRALVVLQLLTAFALGGVVVYFGHKASVATAALCNLRASEVRGLRQAQDFVLRHPNGAFGFTRKEIDSQIAESVKTITALDTLGCEAVPIKAPRDG